MKAFGAVDGERDVKAFGAVEGKRDVKAFGAVEGKRDVKAFGAVEGKRDVKAFGAVEGKRDVKAFGAVDGERDVKAFGAVEGKRDVKAFGAVDGKRDVKAFGAVHGKRHVTRPAALCLALLLCGALPGCTAGPALEDRDAVTGQPGDGQRLVVGSAGFTESDLLAQMYALLLQDAGYRTRILSVTNRELYAPALEQGQIDVVPEYAATFADWLNAKAHGADAPTVGSPDLPRTMTALRALAGPRGLTVLDPGRAVDQNAFAVTAAYAAEHRLKTLSDLGAARLPIRLAAGDECVRRPYCAPGLKEVYGIDVTAVDPKGVGTTQAKQAVQSGQDQLVLTTTTDATLDAFGLVLLDDDKHLQNADFIVPVVNRARAGNERVTRALARLNTVLTTADLAHLNEQVDSWRRLPEDVARNHLTEKGLLPRR